MANYDTHPHKLKQLLAGFRCTGIAIQLSASLPVSMDSKLAHGRCGFAWARQLTSTSGGATSPVPRHVTLPSAQAAA
jgi:hypothetical protein